MFPVSYCNNNKGDTVLFLFQNGVDSGDYLHFFAVTMEWKLLQWGLPRGFGDRWHCSKMWRQSFSDSLTADKSWKKKGDNLRQRQSIFTLDKATCFRFAFCDSDVVTRQRDTFVTTPINIKLLSRSRYLVSCCHVMVQKGRLVCWRVTAFSAKCETWSLSSLVHRCLIK